MLLVQVHMISHDNIPHREMHLNNISLIDSLGDHTAKSYTQFDTNEKELLVCNNWMPPTELNVT